MATPHLSGTLTQGNRASKARVLPGVQGDGSGAGTGTEEAERDSRRVAPAFRVLGAVLLLAHLALVTRLALRPLPVTWVYATNVRPLATIHRLLVDDPAAGIRMIGEGLLLLAPLGVLLPLLSGKVTVSALASFVHTVFLGASVSFAIECLQTTVPGRVFDVDSLLLNTAGVALAHLAVVPGVRARVRRRRRRRRKAAQPTTRPAEAGRVALGPPEKVSYEVAAPRGG